MDRGALGALERRDGERDGVRYGHRDGQRAGQRAGWREGWMERGRVGGRAGWREGGREAGLDGGRDERRVFIKSQPQRCESEAGGMHGGGQGDSWLFRAPWTPRYPSPPPTQSLGHAGRAQPRSAISLAALSRSLFLPLYPSFFLPLPPPLSHSLSLPHSSPPFSASLSLSLSLFRPNTASRGGLRSGRGPGAEGLPLSSARWMCKAHAR